MQDPTAIVRHIIENAWNMGNLDVMDDVVSPEYKRRIPGGRLNGIDAFKEHIASTRVAFPDFHCRIDGFVEENGAGVVSYTTTGTNSGELNGLPSSGRQFESSGMTWFNVRDGKVIEEWELYDRYDVFAQLGLVA